MNYPRNKVFRKEWGLKTCVWSLEDTDHIPIPALVLPAKGTAHSTLSILVLVTCPPPIVGHLPQGAAHHCLDILGHLLLQGWCPPSSSLPDGALWASACWGICPHICAHIWLFSTWLSWVISWLIYVASAPTKDDDLPILSPEIDMVPDT